jgi:hypothetical protein
MRKNLFLFIEIIMFLFIGCTTPQTVMESWIGHSESELVSSWGAPDSTVELNDKTKVYTWKRLWSDDYGVHQGRQSFTIDANGKIIKWSYTNMPRIMKK